jgi:hypothetical protein
MGSNIKHASALNLDNFTRLSILILLRQTITYARTIWSDQIVAQVQLKLCADPVSLPYTKSKIKITNKRKFPVANANAVMVTGYSGTFKEKFLSLFA